MWNQLLIIGFVPPLKFLWKGETKSYFIPSFEDIYNLLMCFPEWKHVKAHTLVLDICNVEKHLKLNK